MCSDTSRRLVSVFLITALALSCSVLEDRDSCPCRLVLDLSRMQERNQFPASIWLETDGITSFWEELTADYPSEEFVKDVPKGVITIHATYGGEVFYSPENGLRIPSGTQCPKVWTYTRKLYLDREEQRDTLVLHKNYCTLDIQVVDAGNKGLGWPFGLEVRGRVDGYDKEGNPSPGDFLVTGLPDREGRFSVRIPRQIDNSLSLGLITSSGTLKTFALGEYIYASGYDWSAQDLQDLPVTVDYASTSVTFSINLWEWTLQFGLHT